MHTLSENDVEYYLDTMKNIVNLSKEYGFEVYLDPWGVGRIFGGEAYSKFLLLNDDARLVTKDGVKGYGACMNNPKTLSFIKSWIEAAAYVGGDYVFWDEPHFSPLTNKDGCFCEICRARFRELFGKGMDLAKAEELTKFRGITKLTFLREVIDHATKLGLKNVLCLLPHDEDITWEEYASLEHLDVFGTDPYWVLHPTGFESWMEDKVQKVANLAKKHGKESEIWIQNFKVKKGEEYLIKKVVDTCKKYGINRVSAWSYKGTYYMSYIRSEDPQKVWQSLLEAYSKV